MAWVLQGGSIVEVSIVGELFGQRTLSVFHYKYTSGVNLADGKPVMDLLAAILNDAGELVDEYANVVSNSLLIRQLVIQKIHPAPRIRRYVYTPAFGIGQVQSPAMTPNVAVAITKTADEATRHGVGTLHLPAVPFAAYDDGEIAAASIPAYDNLLSVLKSPLDTGLWVPVLFNKANPAASLEITETTLQTTLRTMRRRTVGVGQ